MMACSREKTNKNQEFQRYNSVELAAAPSQKETRLYSSVTPEFYGVVVDSERVDFRKSTVRRLLPE